MMAVRAAILMLTGLTWSVVGTAASAWEISLMGELMTRASVVRLADVAVVRDLDDAELKENLEAMIVAPGPTRSRSRELSSSDVRRMAEQRGLDMSQGRFTGAPRVIVTYGESATVPPATSVRGRGTPNSQLRRDMERAGQPRGTAVAVAADQTSIASPSAGQPVVMAVRDLEKGKLIHQDDVTVLYVSEQELPAGAVSCPEDVVGRVMARTIRRDEPLTARMVTKPLLVRSGDSVQVGACCGGIVVTRWGVAQKDGGLGDTVDVATTEGRKKDRIYARVVDVRKVVVMADSLSVSDQLP